MATLNNANAITRRAAMSAGIGYGLACAQSQQTLVASMFPIASTDESRSDADLFAFPASKPSGTAIALTLPQETYPFGIRIHAGVRQWVFEVSQHRRFNFPVFTGTIDSGSGNSPQTRDLIVIEVPNSMLDGIEHSGIWAERFTGRGKRRRIGSPFLTSLLKKNSRLAIAYDSIEPSQDREILLEEVAAMIAAEARGTLQIADPAAYGRRLASTLLPDVLHYNPQLPQGFSFAARNGRHPGEAVAAIIGTAFKGSPAPAPSTTSGSFTGTFPYFPLPVAAA